MNLPDGLGLGLVLLDEDPLADVLAAVALSPGFLSGCFLSSTLPLSAK